MNITPKESPFAPRDFKERDASLRRQFSEREGKTVKTEPLTPEEMAHVRRKYRKKSEKSEATVPKLSEEISEKVRVMKHNALKALTPEERLELTSYLRAVWQKHQHLSKIINNLITTLDPGEVPQKLFDEEYDDLFSLIDDPDAAAARFDKDGFEK
jgi:hypothetical protein